MKSWKYILLLVILFPFMGLVSSCGEDSEEEGEFDNWQQKNEKALEQWAANNSYRKILIYSKNANASSTLKSSDYIYVEVLESGSGTVCPYFTDTIRVAYRGYYIPTKSYEDGLVFDQSYLGEFDWRTAGVIKSVASGFVDGFSTAVMNMHVGDRWRVRIPYQLGYGSSTSSTNSIPAYTNLVFDIALYDVWHPGEHRAAFKTRSR